MVEDIKRWLNSLNMHSQKSNQTSLLIYASGHDHSLQVLEGDVTDYLLISGLGSSEKSNPCYQWR